MIERLDHGDWREAFHAANGPDSVDKASSRCFTIEDVAAVVFASEGQNDGDRWLCIGHLTDGRWFCLSAWCDYTGWDCQSGGEATVASTFDALVQWGMTDEQRSRAGIPQPQGRD